jgi:hypothetical protein
MGLLKLSAWFNRKGVMETKDWPLTLADAVSRIVTKLSDSDKKAIAKMKKKDLVMLHMSMGMGIRNEFGLWQGNDALLESCGPCHPDDVSGVIIEAVWMAVRGK